MTSGGNASWKHPHWPLWPHVAATVNVAPVYTEAMREASYSQSEAESWIMQRESIHMYWRPRCRVIAIASWNVLGMESSGISCMWLVIFSCFVVIICNFPQQWLRAA